MGLLSTYGSRMRALTYQKCERTLLHLDDHSEARSLRPFASTPSHVRSPDPDDNCYNKPVDYPASIYDRFLHHELATNLVVDFIEPARQATAAGLEGKLSSFSVLSPKDEADVVES